MPFKLQLAAENEANDGCTCSAILIDETTSFTAQQVDTAFRCGCYKGHVFINELEHAMEQLQINALDVASPLVGREVRHGPVMVFEPVRKTNTVDYLDLSNDKRLDVNGPFTHTAKEVICREGEIKSFYPFILETKRAGQFVLFPSLSAELKKMILLNAMPDCHWVIAEYCDQNFERQWSVPRPRFNPLLAVSKSLRRTMVETGIYAQAFATEHRKGVYFNKHKDFVHINSFILFGQQMGNTPLIALPVLKFSDFKHPGYEFCIRRLDLDIKNFNCAFLWYKSIIYELKSLRSLYVTGYEVDVDIIHSLDVQRMTVTFTEPTEEWTNTVFEAPYMDVDIERGFTTFRDRIGHNGLYPVFNRCLGDGSEINYTEVGLQALACTNMIPSDFQIDYMAVLWENFGELYRDLPKENKWPDEALFQVRFIPLARVHQYGGYIPAPAAGLATYPPPAPPAGLATYPPPSAPFPMPPPAAASAVPAPFSAPPPPWGLNFNNGVSGSASYVAN